MPTHDAGTPHRHTTPAHHTGTPRRPSPPALATVSSYRHCSRWRGEAPPGRQRSTVRAFYTGHYPLLVTELPRIEDGQIYPPTGPGVGAALQPAIFDRSDLTRRSTETPR